MAQSAQESCKTPLSNEPFWEVLHPTHRYDGKNGAFRSS